MNEEAKKSMEEWQSKLDKVTEDSQARINELQDKLNKVHNVNNYYKWINSNVNVNFSFILLRKCIFCFSFLDLLYYFFYLCCINHHIYSTSINWHKHNVIALV